MEEIKLPKRSDSIYKEIEEFEDYEYSNCIAYEMAIRNQEVKKIIDTIINKIDEIVKYIEDEDAEIYDFEIVSNECDELIKYGINGDVITGILSNIIDKRFKREIGRGGINIEYENDLILNREKEYSYLHLVDDGIVGALDDWEEDLIPYSQMNLDYVPLINKSYSRPTLKLDTSKIFKIELNFNLPKEELLDYISKVKDDFDNGENATIRTPIDLLIYDSSLMEYIGEENNTSEINRKLDALENILFYDNKTVNINKKLIADKFFVYDYVTARKQQVEEMNNQIVEEYEDEIQNIKNDYEDNKTSRINNLKKELSQNIINTTDKQIIEELNKEENISYGTARRYYDDIRPFIDDCKYKELITGRIRN